MGRRSWVLVGLCCMPLLASCVFLLDYDKLKDGEPEPSGMGGLPAAGGTDSVGPEAGAGGRAECGSCDDGDPCTIDTCDETGDVPECLHELSEGLKLDGIDEVLEAEQHVRVSLVAGTDVFYLAALEANDDVTEINLYQLAREGEALEPIGGKLSTALPPGSTIVSNVGLAIDPTLGLALHGFVAIKPTAVSPARVAHVVHRNGDTEANLMLASTYSVHSPWVFPQALAIGNKVFGAWTQEDGTIAVQDVGGLNTAEIFGDATLPATTVSLLSTNNDLPAVMFTSQTDDGTLGAYVESPAHNREPITECQTAAGTYVSSGVVSTQLPGLWFSNITRAGDEYLTTGGATLACGPANCEVLAKECDPEQDLANNVRNVAGATVEADVTGVVYSVIVLPQIALKAGSTTEIEAVLSVSLGQVDFSKEPPESTTIGGDVQGLMELARQDTNEVREFTGPDWPAVGILPTRQVAVAWIQPNLAFTGTELHVQRYKMCLPEP